MTAGLKTVLAAIGLVVVVYGILIVVYFVLECWLLRPRRRGIFDRPERKS
jgi:hypothetical protein